MKSLAILLMLLVTAVTPCFAQEPAVEGCDSTPLSVPGDGALHTDDLVIAETEVIAEAELYLNITTGWVGDWSNISLVSPAGTSVQVQASGGGFSTDFDVTYTDLGAPNTGASELYDCDGCPILPSGPGAMADFEGEATDGTWILNMTTFEPGTLNEWCVRAFLIDAVADLSCVQTAAGVAEISWTNDGAYDEVGIAINGTLAATLAGPFPDGAAGSYTTSVLPTPQLAQVTVFPVSTANGDGPSNSCSVALTIDPAAEIELIQGATAWSATPPYFGIFSFDDTFVVADIQADAEITNAWIGNLDITLVSAASTSVLLHDNNGGFVADIDVTYWELGLPNGSQPYDCDCYMRAAGPGALVDFVGEGAEGVWLMIVSNPGSDIATIDRVALRLYDVGPAYPVQDLSCAAGVTAGTAELSWINGANYEEIAIYISGALAATLVGPFDLGAAGSYTTPIQNVPVLLEVCVEGIAGGVAGEQACCQTLLEADPADFVELLPDFTFTSGTSYTGIFIFSETITIEDMQCDVELTHPFIGVVTASLASPEGTSIFLHNGQGGFTGPGIDVTYWDLGVPNGAVAYSCDCNMQPSGVTGLRDFIGETTLPGAWAIAISATSGDLGTVDRVELRAYDVGPAYPVRDLVCVQASDPTTVSLEWTHGANYDSINVYVNDVLDATLAGPFSADGTGGYLTTAQPVPSTATVCVEGVKAGNPGAQVCCSVFLSVAPVADLVCAYGLGGTESTITWSNPIDYDGFSVFLDGAFLAALPAGTTSYTVTGLTPPGTAEICVEGTYSGLGGSALECCTAFLVEAGDGGACDSPGLAVPGGLVLTTSELTVADLLTLEEVDVLVDITTTFVGDWSNISVISPEGTTVQVHASGGGSGQDFLVIYDNDGVGYGSMPFNCACEMLPSSGAGALTDFSGELSDGTWTLSMVTFTAGTLNTWCVRLLGCESLPPSDLACTTSGSDVTLTWINESTYTSIDVFRDDALLASLDGDDTSYSDPGLGDGRYKYQLVANNTVLGCDVLSDPCRAAVGFLEYCDSSGFDVSPGATAGIETLAITFLDPVIIDEVEVLLQMEVTFTSDWDVFITAPFGTEVQLHNNNGGLGAFDLVWSTSGAANTGFAGQYDCNLCLIQPIGPGALTDFATEVADGDWELRLGSFAIGSLEAWCVAVYEGCTLAPPSATACAAVGNDVEVTWLNSDTYTGIEIERGGVIIATIAGTATSYLDENVLGGLYTYRVFGASASLGCSSGSQRCSIEHLLLESCDGTTVTLSSGAPTATLTFIDAVTVQEAEVSVDLALSFVTDIDLMTVTSPAGTVVGLYDNAFAGTGADMDVIFSEYGDLPDFSTTYSCDGCRLQPVGTGLLTDFENEVADGTWTLTTTLPFTTATLSEWCVRVYEGCGIAPPADVTCADVAEGVELAWTNGATYDSIDVERDGAVIASIAGTETSHVDSDLVPGHLTYRIIGNSSTLDCGARSEECDIAHGRVDVCESPASFISTGLTVTDTLDYAAKSDVVITDMELVLDITTGWVSDWDTIAVDSPQGTSVQVHNNGGSFASNFNVTYSDSGADNTGIATSTGSGVPSIYDCGGCLFKPSGPGAMADFAAEVANGDWTLEMFTFTSGTLNEWCIGAFAEAGDEAGPQFLRGDASGDGLFNALLDGLFMLNYQFNAGLAPPCFDAADASGDNVFNALLDALFVLNYQFNQGLAPPDPGPTLCGVDPDEDAALDCATEPPSCAGP